MREWTHYPNHPTLGFNRPYVLEEAEFLMAALNNPTACHLRWDEVEAIVMPQFADLSAARISKTMRIHGSEEDSAKSLHLWGDDVKEILGEDGEFYIVRFPDGSVARYFWGPDAQYFQVSVVTPTGKYPSIGITQHFDRWANTNLCLFMTGLDSDLPLPPVTEARPWRYYVPMEP